MSTDPLPKWELSYQILGWRRDPKPVMIVAEAKEGAYHAEYGPYDDEYKIAFVSGMISGHALAQGYGIRDIELHLREA